MGPSAPGLPSFVGTLPKPWLGCRKSSPSAYLSREPRAVGSQPVRRPLCFLAPFTREGGRQQARKTRGAGAKAGADGDRPVFRRQASRDATERGYRVARVSVDRCARPGIHGLGTYRDACHLITKSGSAGTDRGGIGLLLSLSRSLSVPDKYGDTVGANRLCLHLYFLGSQPVARHAA